MTTGSFGDIVANMSLASRPSQHDILVPHAHPQYSGDQAASPSAIDIGGDDDAVPSTPDVGSRTPERMHRRLFQDKSQIQNSIPSIPVLYRSP
jgi:hypothetical protein